MKWKSFSIIIVSIVLLSISVIPSSTFVSKSHAYEGLPQSMDADLIIETIQKSYEIENSVAMTFDLFLLEKVYVNDQRGGELSSSTSEFVRSVVGDHSPNNLGYLDYKIAYFSWWKAGALKLEDLKSRAIKENRNLTESELKSLIDENGRVAMPRSQGIQASTELHFISLDIVDDVATSVFDDGLRTNQMILVKLGSQWYIAGNKILSLHP